jgi:hypothetical protein
MPPDGRECAADRRDARLEVEVRPPQPQGPPRSATRAEQEVEEGSTNSMTRCRNSGG